MRSRIFILFLTITAISYLSYLVLFKKTESKQILAETTNTSMILQSSKWVPQTFNNCAPAAVSMLLQHFGYNVSQAEIKKYLRTNSDDKNVFSYEVKDYLYKNYGLEAKIIYDGNLTTIKKLIDNGFYVMVEDLLFPDSDAGHNTIIRGYDNTEKVIIADDPYRGSGVKYTYEEFDGIQWKAFNREYILIYKKEREDLLKKIIGENWIEEIMLKNSEKTNREAVSKNQKDFYSWFNLGTTYFAQGEYKKAKDAFEISKSLGWPKRMLWYQYQPIQTLNIIGDYKNALEMINQALSENQSYPELHYEAALAYQGLRNMKKAKEEAGLALKYDPGFTAAKNLYDNI